MRIRSTRLFALIVIASLLITLFAWLAYRRTILSVIGLETYILVYDDGGYVLSPSGKTKLRITYLDAGATHSGKFFTYVTVSDWWKDTRVVAEGFSSYPVRYGRAPFPIEWVDERSFYITFLEGHSGEPKKVLAHVE